MSDRNQQPPAEADTQRPADATDQQPPDERSAGADHKLAVFFLGAVVVVLLTVAIIAFAAQATVMDEDHVVETMDEEGVYASIAASSQTTTSEAINDSVDDEYRDFMAEDDFERIDEIAADAVTEAYIRGEIDRNIGNIYAYFDGADDEFRLAVNLTEPKQQVLADIQNESRYFAQVIDIEEVEGEIPDEKNLTADGELPEAMEDVQSAFGIIGLLWWLLPLVSLGLIGLVYAVTKSPQRAGNTAGAALATTGILGLIIGFTIGGFATSGIDSALDADSAEATAFADGFIAVVDSMFSSIVTQSAVLTVAGFALMGIVYADREGQLEGVKAAIGLVESPDSEEPQQQPAQQQGQYQHGQQGHGPQAGQYQQTQQGAQYQQAQQGGQYQQGGAQGTQQYQQGQYDEQYQQGQGQYDEQYQQGQGQYDEQYQQGQGQYNEQYQQDQGQYDEQYQQDQGQYDEQYQQDQGQYDEQYQQGQGQYDEQYQQSQSQDTHQSQQGETDYQETAHQDSPDEAAPGATDGTHETEDDDLYYYESDGQDQTGNGQPTNAGDPDDHQTDQQPDDREAADRDELADDGEDASSSADEGEPGT